MQKIEIEKQRVLQYLGENPSENDYKLVSSQMNISTQKLKDWYFEKCCLQFNLSLTDSEQQIMKDIESESQEINQFQKNLQFKNDENQQDQKQNELIIQFMDSGFQKQEQFMLTNRSKTKKDPKLGAVDFSKLQYEKYEKPKPYLVSTLRHQIPQELEPFVKKKVQVQRQQSNTIKKVGKKQQQQQQIQQQKQTQIQENSYEQLEYQQDLISISENSSSNDLIEIDSSSSFQFVNQQYPLQKIQQKPKQQQQKQQQQSWQQLQTQDFDKIFDHYYKNMFKPVAQVQQREKVENITQNSKRDQEQFKSSMNQCFEQIGDLQLDNEKKKDAYITKEMDKT